MFSLIALEVWSQASLIIWLVICAIESLDNWHLVCFTCSSHQIVRLFCSPCEKFCESNWISKLNSIVGAPDTLQIFTFDAGWSFFLPSDISAENWLWCLNTVEFKQLWHAIAPFKHICTPFSECARTEVCEWRSARASHTSKNSRVACQHVIASKPFI